MLICPYYPGRLTEYICGSQVGYPLQRVTFSATAWPVDPGDVSRRAGGAKHLLASKSIDVIQSSDYFTNAPSVPEPGPPPAPIVLKTIYGLVAGAVILFLCGCGCGMSRYFKYMAAKDKVRHGDDVEQTQVSEVWNQQFFNFEKTSTKDPRPQSPEPGLDLQALPLQIVSMENDPSEVGLA